MKKNINTIEKLKSEKMINRWVDRSREELKFLWSDAHDIGHSKEVRDRKIKQYWDMYRLYRSQREYFQVLLLPQISLKSQ